MLESHQRLHTSKLIVLRGNSGSGKSVVAQRVRAVAGGRIAIIEQDYLRRYILKEKETEGTDNIDLIEQTVQFALERNYDVILEGILYFPRYGAMLGRLAKSCPNKYFFYFDVSFEETLLRHATKPNAHEFGETEMRDWYKPNQQTGFPDEVILPESHSLEDSVATILRVSSLK